MFRTLPLTIADSSPRNIMSISSDPFTLLAISAAGDDCGDEDGDGVQDDGDNADACLANLLPN